LEELAPFLEQELSDGRIFGQADGAVVGVCGLARLAETLQEVGANCQDGSERWIRTKWNSVQQYRDGLTIDAFGLPPVATAIAKMMSVRMLRWASSRGTENGYSKLMLSAPLIGFIAVRDRYAQELCLQAGRIWQRAHLFATAHGLAARPCNEAVEMMDHERALGRPASRAALLNEITADPTWHPTFVFYMGYPKLSAHASPRRPVEG